MIIFYGLSAILVGLFAQEHGFWGGVITSGFLLIFYQIIKWTKELYQKNKRKIRIRSFIQRNSVFDLRWIVGYTGRINRAKYWAGHIVGIGASSLTVFIAQKLLDLIAVNDADTKKTLLFFAIYGSLTIIYSPIVIKRLHDLDKSGYWGLLCFVPLLNLYPGLLMAFRKGTPGENIFGPDPLQHSMVGNPANDKKATP